MSILFRQRCRRTHKSPQTFVTENFETVSSSSLKAATSMVMAISVETANQIAADTAAAECATDEADCRICLDREAKVGLVAPCACTGSMEYAHRECLERWCMEKGSGCCEVCGTVYKDAGMLHRLQQRLREQRRRSELTEWPEHDWPEHDGVDPAEDLLLRRQHQAAAHAPSSRRVMAMSMLFLTAILLFLAQVRVG